MPPEYIVEGILSTKYDVYSFGVILLETIGSMSRFDNFRHQASVEWVSQNLHTCSIYLTSSVIVSTVGFISYTIHNKNSTCYCLSSSVRAASNFMNEICSSWYSKAWRLMRDASQVPTPNHSYASC
jgi:hypothetical protein